MALMVLLSVLLPRRLSSAPHWARVMMVGWTAAAEAEAAGVLAVRFLSAGEVPGSIVVTWRSGRVRPCGVSTRTWMPVPPSVTIGVVPNRAPTDSGVPASGPSSGTGSSSHAVQPFASLMRT